MEYKSIIYTATSAINRNLNDLFFTKYTIHINVIHNIPVDDTDRIIPTDKKAAFNAKYGCLDLKNMNIAIYPSTNIAKADGSGNILLGRIIALIIPASAPTAEDSAYESISFLIIVKKGKNPDIYTCPNSKPKVCNIIYATEKYVTNM
jgi:hypothetical protein